MTAYNKVIASLECDLTSQPFDLPITVDAGATVALLRSRLAHKRSVEAILAMIEEEIA